MSDIASYVAIQVYTDNPMGGERRLISSDYKFIPCPITGPDYSEDITSGVTEIRITDSEEYLHYGVSGQDSGTLEIVQCI